MCIRDRYRTIEEVAGPLMLVRGVENVNYNDLGEIILSSGEKRRCKVLEIDGSDAMVQLFEPSTGINLSTSKVRFLGRSIDVYKRQLHRQRLHLQKLGQI